MSLRHLRLAMPIYEYVCKKCGQHHEVLHKVDEKPRLACDHCGAKPLSRQVSAAGFRLSGSGWYETDFKSDNKKNLAGDKTVAPVTAEESKPKAEPVAATPVKTEPVKKERPSKSQAKPTAKTAAKPRKGG